jgi:hypothetical protein
MRHLSVALALSSALLGGCSTLSADAAAHTSPGTHSRESAHTAGGAGASAAAQGGHVSSDAGFVDSEAGAMAGATGGRGAAEPNSCASCQQNEICVSHRVQGGALILPDGGSCPEGRVATTTGGRVLCELVPTYSCEQLPIGCGASNRTVASTYCTCAPSLCAGGGQCRDVSTTTVECVLLVP